MPRLSRKPGIPAFVLYGEPYGRIDAKLHIEPIQSRSRLHRWEIDPHTHHALHQVLWVAAGPAEIELDGTRQQCDGPVAVVIPPGVVHGFRFSADTDGQVLTFNPAAMIEGDAPGTGDALRALFAAARVLPFAAGSEPAGRIGMLMEGLAAEFAAPDAADSPVPLWLARSAIWRLARHGAQLEKAGREQHALFTRFTVLVEEHHRDHWPVARYADALGLSVERLNRLTRAETGQAALDLVHDRLTREACRRLMYIAAPIATLAFELGFEDPGYFCRFFKRRTGRSPRAFRRVVEEPYSGGGERD